MCKTVSGCGFEDRTKTRWTKIVSWEGLDVGKEHVAGKDIVAGNIVAHARVRVLASRRGFAFGSLRRSTVLVLTPPRLRA